MIDGVVVRGYGAASGQRAFRALGGTIRAQLPVFLQRGLDLGAYFPGTINLDTSPLEFDLHRPLITLTDVAWNPGGPVENFSFSPCVVQRAEERWPALIYYPRPETKGPYGPMPPRNLIEVLAPKIEGLTYGDQLSLRVNPAEISFSAAHSDHSRT